MTLDIGCHCVFGAYLVYLSVLLTMQTRKASLLYTVTSSSADAAEDPTRVCLITRLM